MYKVFLNNKAIVLCNPAEKFSGCRNILLMQYESPSELETIVNDFERQKKLLLLVIYNDDVLQLWNEFQQLFVIIHAAGGIVKNEMGDILFIFRKGMWDLPKGKIETGEDAQEAAVREVEEECGIKINKVARESCSTWHVYFENNLKILKHTTWFEMSCIDAQPLLTQAEEQITDAQWVNREWLPLFIPKTYPAIQELLKNYLHLRYE